MDKIAKWRRLDALTNAKISKKTRSNFEHKPFEQKESEAVKKMRMEKLGYNPYQE